MPVERWAPVEPRSMRSDPRLVIAGVAAVAVCVVFACSFAIGRITDSHHAAPAEGSSALAIASGGPAIPVGLSSAPPLDAGTLPSAGAPAPRHRSSNPAAAPTTQPLSSHFFPAPVQLSRSVPVVSAAPEASAAPAVTLAPIPTPTRSSPSSGSSGSGGGSSRGGAAAPSGGASFDSSG